MADAWVIVTPQGRVELNPTFSSPTWEPGSVSGPGALRRDELGTYQRSGDGLRTPGPLIISGRVWSDARDTIEIIAELNLIQEAVRNATTAIRSNNAGEYVFQNLEGGPTAEILPDGVGGWVVTINLWPARPTPVFRSAALNNLRPRVRVSAEFLSGALRDIAQRAELPEVGVALTPEFLGGALEEPVVRREIEPTVVLEPEFHSGSLRDVVVRPPELPQETVELSPEFHAGSLDEIGVKRIISRTVTLTPEFTSGTLEEA